MEDIIGYIIIFVFGLGALYLYQWRKDKMRVFPLSEQHYSGNILTVLIRKHGGDTESLILRFRAKNDLVLEDISVELISDEKRLHTFSLNSLSKDHPIPVKIISGDSKDFEFILKDLKDEITGQSVKFNAFRFAVQTETGKKFKSHRLAFNKRWSVFKPDTGRYN